MLTRTHRLFPHLGTAISPPDGRFLARGRVCLMERETEADAALSRFAELQRDVLKQHLALAEKHIAEGVVHVEQERQIVEELKRRGQDVRRSADLLELFKETLADHISERDRVLEELAARS